VIAIAASLARATYRSNLGACRRERIRLLAGNVLVIAVPAIV